MDLFKIFKIYFLIFITNYFFIAFVLGSWNIMEFDVFVRVLYILFNVFVCFVATSIGIEKELFNIKPHEEKKTEIQKRSIELREELDLLNEANELEKKVELFRKNNFIKQ